MSEQPGTFGTDTDAQQIVTEVLVLDGEEIETLVGLAFDDIDGDGLEFVGDSGEFEGEVALVDGGEEIEIVGAEWHSDGEKEVVEWHRGPRVGEAIFTLASDELEFTDGADGAVFELGTDSIEFTGGAGDTDDGAVFELSTDSIEFAS